MMPRNGADTLTAEQLSDLRWLLPESRPGYDAVFKAIRTMVILAEGRWGDGDYILGHPGSTADPTGPMAPVFAHGLIEFKESRRTVIVHDMEERSIEVQFETHGNGEGDHHEIRRHSYSEWLPGLPSPALGARVREIPLRGGAPTETCTLALCAEEQRVWLHEAAGGTNWLIPCTAFYNELMRVTGEKRPEFALAPKRLFSDNGRFADKDLTRAIHAYNAAKRRVGLPPLVAQQAGKVSLFKRMLGL
jgi:hypothetical protein